MNIQISGVGLILALLAAGQSSQVSAQTKIKASEVVINGESFFAAANITSELTRLARVAGAIGASESFREIAVSGAVMSGILNQYKNCNPKPVYLITDGGGNDLMGSCGNPVTTNCAAIKNTLVTVQQYFDQMKTSGTKKVIWMRYPDPQKANFANLKANQDVYNPEVEKICKASVEPKCLWIDMRKTWEGHYDQYTQDGIHPTPAGGTATAEAFWKFAKDNNFFDLGATSTQTRKLSPASPFRGQFISHQTMHLSLSLSSAAPVTVSLSDLSGKSVFQATELASEGTHKMEFPLAAVVSGVYRLRLQAGAFTQHLPILVP